MGSGPAGRQPPAEPAQSAQLRGEPQWEWHAATVQPALQLCRLRDAEGPLNGTPALYLISDDRRHQDLAAQHNGHVAADVCLGEVGEGLLPWVGDMEADSPVCEDGGYRKRLAPPPDGPAGLDLVGPADQVELRGR